MASTGVTSKRPDYSRPEEFCLIGVSMIIVGLMHYCDKMYPPSILRLEFTTTILGKIMLPNS